MYNLSLSAFDFNGAGLVLISFTKIIVVLLVLISPFVVERYIHKAKQKNQAQSDAKDPEQAAQSQPDDKQ